MWRALLFVAAATPAVQPVSAASLCKFYDHADELAGHVLTVRGAYGWEIHHRWVLPDGCKDDEEIFVGLSPGVEDKIWQFLRSTYPGVNFGGGTVWGTFTGVVVVPKEGPAYIRLTNADIDETKRMVFAKP